MKILSTYIFILMLILGCESKDKKKATVATDSDQIENSKLTADEEKEGWQLLFDGKTKAGWHVYNNQSEGTAWEVQNGVLHLNPIDIKVTPVPGAGDLTQAVGGGDLATDQEYENFHLKLDWKVGSPSNSGVMMFVKEVPEHGYPWETGPEIQIMEKRECSDDLNCVGDLYGLVASPRDLDISKDWNQLEIIVNNSVLEVIMNGRKLYTTTMWDDQWKALIAKTKFAAWPEFGTYKKGKIVLQDHGHAVWYRNIKIRKL